MAKSENNGGTPAAPATRRPRKAAAFGAHGRAVMLPPVSRENAENEFGAAISDDAWLKICHAFDLHGGRLADLQVTRDNQNKNDEQGWETRKRDAERGIEAALFGLLNINRRFLVEAAGNVSFLRRSERPITHVEQHLDRAIEEVKFLSWIMREAEPLSREILTEAESRKALARDVFAALESAGASLSNGWAVAREEPSYADLTGFERLAELLEIHQGGTPRATAKWLRDALGT